MTPRVEDSLVSTSTKSRIIKIAAIKMVIPPQAMPSSQGRVDEGSK
jgi:hypothetical protein